MRDLDTPAVLTDLPLASIRPSATNPRKTLDEAALFELMESIAASGLATPVLVRPVFVPIVGDPNMHELVTGSRRFAACQKLGRETIPAIVREMSDEEVLDIQIVENLQRADVHPIEEAEGYRVLIERAAWPGNETIAQDLTPEDVARRVGKTTAYVAQRMRLLSLEVLAKRLFAESHITLGQALLLARLTIVDQVRAMVFLLGIAAWEIKRDSPAEKLIADRIETWTKAQTSEHRMQYAGARLIKPTEVELKRWIADNVLLLLKDAPWRLDDAALLPIAGPCTTCPKRSGANAALFSDLTPEGDVCTDQACFAAKRKAFIAYAANEAKGNQSVLLKLSSKRSEEKLPELVTEKTLFKQGQWVPAEPNSCPAWANGMLRDGDDAGKVITVCCLQTCKVHKHKVDAPRPVSSGSSGAKQESHEERQKREVAEEEALLAAELPVRRAVYDAMLAKLTPEAKFLQTFLTIQASGRAAAVCDALGIEFKRSKEQWQANGVATEALQPFVAAATLEQMHQVAFHALHVSELAPRVWDVRAKDHGREALWGSAKHLGVDADAIATRVAAEMAGGVPAAEVKPVPAKTAAAKKSVANKPAAKKATPARKVREGGKALGIKKLSPAGRKTIADAMKKRWAERRADLAKPTAKKAAKAAAKKAVRA